MTRSLIRVVIHGGCGRITRDSLGPGREQAVREALAAIAADTRALLEDGTCALDAAEQAVVRLEDAEYFNAGYGSVLNAEGRVETDAALMEGTAGRSGAVAALTGVRNPVKVARRVLERDEHVLLVGYGAHRFAESEGCGMVAEDELVIRARREQLAAAHQAGRVSLDHDEKYGTVGAVVRDARGQLAAASSTGGMTNKHPGRVGDTPIVGGGIWADDRTCAVLGTGHGEFFIRAAFAHDVHARMAYAGMSLAEACNAALDRVSALGGNGGAIGIDFEGNLAMPFTTTGMYRGWVDADSEPRSAIFEGEESVERKDESGPQSPW